MKHHHVDYTFNLKRQLVTLGIRELVYLVAITLLVMSLVFVSIHQTTILVPYNLDKRMKVSVSTVDKNYLSSLALADISLYFNYTPSTITVQTKRFLQRISPENYGQAQVKLLLREKNIIRNNYTESFFPDNIHVDERHKQVTIQGMVTKSIDNKVVGLKPQSMRIIVDYQLLNGYAYIKSWSYQHAA